jgi:uncharacterized protein (TIGR04141 family)
MHLCPVRLEGIGATAAALVVEVAIFEMIDYHAAGAGIRAVIRQNEYRVVIVIVGGPGTALQLPFFSRVTLKNSYKLLDAYGYRVAVSHVP